MQIQSYQIHNVLNVYRRQLSQGKPERPLQSGGNGTATDSISISPEGKNQAIMEKVADSVLKKITNINPESVLGEETIKTPKPSDDESVAASHVNRFVFNTIAEDNRLETRSIAVDNSQMMMRRLDELAKAAINRNNE